MKKNKQLVFSEYIKKIPSSIVFKHLLKENKKERKIISSELIEIIKSKFTSEESLILRFDMMCFEVKKICVLTYLFGSSGLKAIEYKKYHKELLTSFFIYAAHDKFGTEYYFGFKDIEKLLSRKFASFLYERAKVEVNGQPTPFLSRRCLNDFIMVLVLALAGLLKKKRDGGLIQISFTELKNNLHTTAESCMFYEKEQDVKKIIQLLLAYGTDRGYLTEEDKSYTTTFEQIDQWLSCSHQELYEDFIDFAVDYCGGWSMSIFNKMLDAGQNSWLSTSAFPVSCRDRAFTVLQVLHYVGIIEVDSNDNDILWRSLYTQIDFCDTDSKQKVIILPNFSAILPQEVLPEILYTFSMLGTFSNLDRVYKGIINRNSVNESLSRGIDGDVLISHLSEWQAPENVIETVKEWIREYSRLCVINTNTIVAFDEKTSMQISSYQPLSNIIEPLNAYKVFAIEKGLEMEARELLMNMGFDPRVPEIQLPKPVSTESLLVKDTVEELTLSLDFWLSSKTVSRPIMSGKYSEGLKELEVSELFRVIDYAILMGHCLILEYEGSPYIKQGMHTIIPLKLINGTGPYVEGRTETSKINKKYYIKKINKIGVKSS